MASLKGVKTKWIAADLKHLQLQTFLSDVNIIL